MARGVTATFGNVFEPYLELTIEPQLLLRALSRGWNLGDAAFFATPALSWQTVVIGDPLYRPFATPLDAQLAGADALPPALAPYVLLRKVRLLEHTKKDAEAMQLLRDGVHRRPGLVLALALAQRLAAGGDKTGAAQVLASTAGNQLLDSAQAPLGRQAARLLLDCGAASAAVAVYRQILGIGALEQPSGKIILREAIDAARVAGEPDQAAAWETELARLTNPALPGPKR